MNSKGNFIINKKEFSPKSLKVNYESLASEDSGRTDDGVMRIEWVKRCVRKLEIIMPPMTANEVSELLPLVQGKEYNITYFDPLTNSERTINVYTSNSSGDCFSGVLRGGLYTNVGFNCIELAGE